MNSFVLDGSLFAYMMRGGSENLKKNRSIVNDLNVFPVPDGDTGDNMYMTVKSGVDNVKPATSDLGCASKEAARGMLLGARGNSGVILSRIFAGIADALEGVITSDVQTMCRAFEEGVKKAYGAVSTPVEGTILTVYREAAEYVSANREKYTTFEELFEDFLAETRRSLERTPELLKVLKDAGVVDSGGAGLYYIIEGMRKALDSEDQELKEAEETLSNSDYALVNSKEGISERLDEKDEAAFGYCTEFLLQVMPSKCRGKVPSITQVEKWLIGMGGESIVAFSEDDIIKVHVHTRNPGKVIEHFQKYGEYLKLKIENMTLQNKSVTIRNNFPKAEGDAKPEKADGPVLTLEKTKQKYAYVAVAAGEGLVQMFKEGGADAVVDGGQSNNPSAEHFIECFKTLNAENIIVLPNNKNIILTAQQAAELYDGAKVSIFPSKTVGEGYAALMCADVNSTDTPEDMLAAMQGCAKGVETGYVSKAIRDSATGSVKVTAGDYVGFANGEILSDSADINEAAVALCESLGASSHDVVIVVCGQERTGEEGAKLCEKLSAKFPKTEFAPAPGGQPIYDYILIFE
ncbi:MAG: DAK2 domain-containing protein [Lachnospiraceae bacterium]|nr:DAK2 domain-containing protein [Lachnospiraceae bacterium]